MRVLVDTNVLLRAAQAGHPHQRAAREAVSHLLRRGDDVCVVPQCLYEFYVVATRPVTANGLGMVPAAALAELQRLKSVYALLGDGLDVFNEWETLVAAHAVSGKPAHDARLVAAMNARAVPAILTFNVSDFSRYPGIQVLDPTTMIQVP